MAPKGSWWEDPETVGKPLKSPWEVTRSTLEYGDYIALNQSLGQSTGWIETNPN